MSEELLQAAQSSASSLAVSEGYMLIGFIVVIIGFLALAIKFSPADEKQDIPSEDMDNELMEGLQTIKLNS